MATRVAYRTVPGWLSEAGTGPPVLLVHGWTAFKEVFADLQAALADTGRRAVAVDLPGWGGRPEPPGLVRDAAGYAREIAATLHAVGPCVVVGHSLGGQIALRLAVDQPALVRRLVLISTPVIPAPRRWTLPRTLVHAVGLPRIGKGVATAAVATMKRRPGRAVEAYRRSVADPEALAANGRVMALADRAIETFRDTPATRIGDSLWRIANTDLRDILPRVRQPTLVVVGERDWSVNPANSERIASGLHDARLLRVPDAAHIPFLECPDMVIPAVCRFIQEDRADERT